MIYHELDRKTGVLLVQPGGPLSRDDFRSLAAAVDPYILEAGNLKALISRVETFPGWENLVGLVEHFRFVKEHHRYIEKVAFVTDSKLVRLMPKLAEHFVNAEISAFPYSELDAARRWVEETDGV
jgi:hypothetical protein